MAGPVAFVGRERELSRLLKALGGDARLVLVTGDAGVGKTRLAGEGIARAVAGGLVVVRGECMPLSATLPLLPVAAALGELAELEGGAVMEAALAAVPGFVRGEVGRLVPRLGPGDGLGRDERGEGWQRARLFSAVAELLGAVAGCCGAGVGLVVEDVHWADRATLDCLTFLGWAGRAGAVRAVVTCRSDEAPVEAHVAAWLAQARGAAGVEEITVGPLARPEVAGQVAALAGGLVPSRVVDELFARAEGNPFFTEQLVAAALAGGEAEGGLQVPAGLPTRLAELLVARAGRCAGDARAVLNALAVAGRPLAEDLLAKITGLEPDVVRGGLRELAAARLLAADAEGGVHRPRHALLAEAVVGGLLPGERVMLHERIALALAGGQALAAEVAGHWRAAGRPAEELTARVTAAGAAERVFGYAEAAAHWQRAIHLSDALPGGTSAAGIALPGLYRRAIDALYLAGDGVHAGVLAEEAYHRFAGHPDRLTAAVAHHRAAYYRAIDAPAAALPLMEEALRLFEPTPPSAEHARVWLDYAKIQFAGGSPEDRLPAVNRALQIAEAADATGLIPVILAGCAGEAFGRGQVEQGLAILQRGWALASASGDGPAVVWLAVAESDALLKLAQFYSAAEVALRGLEAARQAGLEAWYGVTVLAANASEALLALGRTAQAAALIDPLTTGAPDLDRWVVHESRAEIDLLRGDIDAAAGRHRRVRVITGPIGDMFYARESACLGAEVALWAGQPGGALDEAGRVFPLLETPGRSCAAGCWHWGCGRVPTWPSRPGRAATHPPPGPPRRPLTAWSRG
jgi:tetratricopeptide (TPR) repeat protein